MRKYEDIIVDGSFWLVPKLIEFTFFFCLAFSSLSLQLPRHLACTRKPICASESAARIEAQVAREETERGDVAPRRELCQHRPAVAILYRPGVKSPTFFLSYSHVGHFRS